VATNCKRDSGGSARFEGRLRAENVLTMFRLAVLATSSLALYLGLAIVKIGG
jgi:hypothetical protein